MSFLDTIHSIFEGLKIFSNAESKVDRLYTKYEHKVGNSLKKARRKFFATVVAATLYVAGVAFLLTAAILFSYRFVSLDIIFVILAVISLYIGFLFHIR